MTVAILVTAVLLSVALAGAAVWRPPRRGVQVAFALGVLAFGLEAALQWALVARTGPEPSFAPYLTAIKSVSLLVPAPWCLFAFLSARRAAPVPRPWRLSFAAGSAGLLLTVGLGLVRPFLEPVESGGVFRGAVLTPAGQLGVAIETLATVAVLYGLEPSIRNSWGSTRWRVKYLALGLGAVFLARFYLLSQTLLFGVLRPDAFLISGTTVVLGEALAAIGLARTGGLRSDLAVSRHFVYRSLVVGAAGGYLLLAGTAGWLLNTLGVPEKTFWSTLVLFVAAVGLASLLLSENLRWRLKRWVSTHFYAEKYDYRQQWREFTQSLARRVTLGDLTSQLLRAVMGTLGTPRAALYLTPEDESAPRLLTAQGALAPLPPTLDVSRRDFAVRDGAPQATAAAGLGNGRAETLAAAGMVVAVPLSSQGRLLGVMLVGAERTEAPYDQEDLDLLTTLGEQAASALATLQLSERLAQTRAFEAFHRLTSFVVHDLKNSIGALSLLTANFRQHAEDPEFRRDALRTLAATVERMQRLLGRLSSRQAVDALAAEELDLVAVVEDTVAAVLRSSRVRTRLEHEPVAAVRADGEVLQRVLHNILTNAVEAMDGEGEITIRVFGRDGMVGCAVTDTGCGMSAEFMRTSLFVPFQTTKKGGWGIGLYESRELLGALGGRLEVQSQEGRGTTMTVWLPEARR